MGCDLTSDLTTLGLDDDDDDAIERAELFPFTAVCSAFLPPFRKLTFSDVEDKVEDDENETDGAEVDKEETEADKDEDKGAGSAATSCG